MSTREVWMIEVFQQCAERNERYFALNPDVNEILSGAVPQTCIRIHNCLEGYL